MIENQRHAEFVVYIVGLRPGHISSIIYIHQNFHTCFKITNPDKDRRMRREPRDRAVRKLNHGQS